MREIIDNRIQKRDGKFIAQCKCGKEVGFKVKDSALTMLARGNCRYCKKDYRSIAIEVPIYKSGDRWCCTCSGCGKEQAYTRKEHAKQSVISDWQCKKCRAYQKGFDANTPVGWKKRIYNKFRKSANSRGLAWGLTLDTAWGCYTGICSLTGMTLDPAYLSKSSPSLDRIDSTKGYTPDNIQWVHPKVNLAKRNMPNDEFIAMCIAVASRAKRD